MAYNPYFNGYFQPQMYQPQAMPDALNQLKVQYQPPTQPLPTIPTASNDMIWVLGEVEATSYPVAPNATVTLWDKNESTLYIKSANAQGVPSMRILDYSERTPNTPKQPAKHVCKCGDNYVKITDFEALQADFDGLKKEVQNLTSRQRTRIKKEDDENA